MGKSIESATVYLCLLYVQIVEKMGRSWWLGTREISAHCHLSGVISSWSSLEIEMLCSSKVIYFVLFIVIKTLLFACRSRNCIHSSLTVLYSCTDTETFSHKLPVATLCIVCPDCLKLINNREVMSSHLFLCSSAHLITETNS
jgi:hypothetical protein